MNFSYHHPKIEQRGSPQKGVGLFATASIPRGEITVITAGRILPFDQLKDYELPLHAFQVEKDFVLAPIDLNVIDGIFSVNHSCSPTTGLRGQTSLIALRDIGPGEEITFDYCMTDSDPAGVQTFEMICLCESSECRKKITDLDWRQKSLQNKYRGFFSSYIQARITAA